MTPRVPPNREDVISPYDRVFHLGYEGWPTPDLPQDVWHRFVRTAHAYGDKTTVWLDLDRPWITDGLLPLRPIDLAIGFSDEHFELKLGICWALQRHGCDWVNVSGGPRWKEETGLTVRADWVTAASWIKQAQVFLGCCSALHVLAVAVGTPAVVMEPNPDRLNDVFWPLGKTGPQVTQVLGGDGRWTWDARHVRETIERVRTERTERRREVGA